MRVMIQFIAIIVFSLPLVGRASELIVIAHGVSTGAYLAPTLRAKAKNLGIDLQIAHLQIGELAAELAPTYDRSSYDFEYKFKETELEKATQFLNTLNLRYSVIPGTENAVMFTDHINETLGLLGNGSALTELKRNKEKLYKHLRKMGLNRAPFIGVSSVQEGLNVYQGAGLEFPIVVKPIDDAGGNGFHKVYNVAELEAALKDLFSPTTTTVFNEPNKRVVMQTALVGPEVAVQGVVLHGEVVFTDVIEYTKTNAVYERDLLADPTSPLTHERTAVAKKVLDATNIRNFSFHIEMIQDARFGYVPIDVASRPMGGVDHLVVKECSGYNQLDAIADALLQPHVFLKIARERRKSGIPYQRQKSGCVLDFIQRQNGEVVGRPDIEFLKSLPSYLGHKTNLEPGSQVRVTTNMLNAGGVLWLAGTAAQVEADEQAFRAHEKSGKFIAVKPTNSCVESLKARR